MPKITEHDLALINDALSKGLDVCIQNTPDGGCRIVAHRVTVLKRSDGKKQPQYGFSEKRT